MLARSGTTYFGRCGYAVLSRLLIDHGSEARIWTMEVYQTPEELNDAMKMKAHGLFGSHQDEWRDVRVDGPCLKL
jgi:hypothetical protein